MSRNAKTTNIEVQYRNAEPKKLTVSTKYADGEFLYKPEYTFSMSPDGIARLTAIKPDGDTYTVTKAEGTRKAAEESVQELPFVNTVVMIE